MLWKFKGLRLHHLLQSDLSRFVANWKEVLVKVLFWNVVGTSQDIKRKQGPTVARILSLPVCRVCIPLASINTPEFKSETSFCLAVLGSTVMSNLTSSHSLAHCYSSWHPLYSSWYSFTTAEKKSFVCSMHPQHFHTTDYRQQSVSFSSKKFITSDHLWCYPQQTHYYILGF